MEHVQRDFNESEVLNKPLMAHLSTVDKSEARDSPVWFLWHAEFIWVLGGPHDSFIQRIGGHPKCAIGVVDFDVYRGILKHVGIRGSATLNPATDTIITSILSKYLGPSQSEWNDWFVNTIVGQVSKVVQITPHTIVAKNVSYFKTGPELAE